MAQYNIGWVDSGCAPPAPKLVCSALTEADQKAVMLRLLAAIEDLVKHAKQVARATPKGGKAAAKKKAGGKR